MDKARAGFLSQAIATNPIWFATAVMSAYFALALPLLARAHFDFSVFIVAGDFFVSRTHLISPILVKPHSNGYDGQFYYRLALDPFLFAKSAYGIAFDNPAWRMQRIFYPVLARMFAIGQPLYLPASLFILNLAGIGGIAASAALLARRIGAGWAVPIGMVLWPGWIVSLTHDTTEIISAALLLASLCAYASERLILYAILAAGAALTRETTILVFAGVLIHALWRGGFTAANLRRVILCLLPFLPFGLWRAILTLAWRGALQDAGAGNIDWPFLGAAKMLFACITGTRSWAVTPLKDGLMRALVLLTALPLIAFCALVATRLRLVARNPTLGHLAAAWLLVAALMSVLGAQGPWIDPVAYFRAFSECVVLGWLVLGSCKIPRYRLRAMALANGAMVFALWMLCAIQTR